MYEMIVNEAKKMIEEFLSVVPMNKGEILVVGCSSSEIVGETIGRALISMLRRRFLRAFLPLLRRGEYSLRHSAASILIARSWWKRNVPKSTVLTLFV